MAASVESSMNCDQVCARLRANDPTLREIKFWNEPHGNEVAAALAPCLPASTHVKTLWLVRCNLNLTGLGVLLPGLHGNTSLTKLLLDGNPIGDIGAFMLGVWLSSNPRLETFSLGSLFGGCGLTTLGLSALLPGLHGNRTLSHLFLSQNALMDEGARVLALWLSDNPPLKNLWLHNCGITAQGAEFLLDAINVNDQLQDLHLFSSTIASTAPAAPRCC
eukprot:m.96449 g.96449  ORF g.96449 m.96449 type:complete len:219 (-) comp8633_c0_seq1:302-958(-)